ncbi:hypothetical protein BDB01DRAFT_797186 [Pilobolus umbonatus]|nr:hypothetical protein BDB01DRAFT_797186 [Pilobolus umbonatus]
MDYSSITKQIFASHNKPSVTTSTHTPSSTPTATKLLSVHNIPSTSSSIITPSGSSSGLSTLQKGKDVGSSSKSVLGGKSLSDSDKRHARHDKYASDKSTKLKGPVSPQHTSHKSGPTSVYPHFKGHVPNKSLIDPRTIPHPTIDFKGHLYKVLHPVAPITLNARDSCPNLQEILALIEAQAINKNKNDIHFNTFIPYEMVISHLENRPVSIMDMTPTEVTVEYGKLRDTMTINELAGFVYHPSKPTEGLAIVPPILLKGNFGIREPKLHEFSLIYLSNLPPKPIEWKDLLSIGKEDSVLLHSWESVSNLLRFTEEMKSLALRSEIEVSCSSLIKEMLRSAVDDLITRRVSTEKKLILVDRYDKQIFNLHLTQQKMNPNTIIYEIGFPDFLHNVTPPTLAYPVNTGGYITTDIKNLLANPSLVETIVNAVQQANIFSGLHTKWKFILFSGWEVTLRELADEESMGRAQEVFINLSLALTMDQLSIIRIWSDNEVHEPVEQMKRLVNKFYHERRFFLYVDDVSSVVEKNSCCADFVKSADILSVLSR